MTTLVAMIHHITWLLQPFMPDSAKKIFEMFGDENKKEVAENYKFIVRKGAGLFPRL